MRQPGEKRLKPATIIPESQYVLRAADRQLDEVVASRGRPGYILVARQMGKTNLLINMKRNRERAGDLVCYIDLSNRYSDARGLFRSIVDSIIESFPDRFDYLREKITSDRDSSKLLPNVEYDRHLRLILSAAGASPIVIVLDEIDSLINTSYSDNILAQIRSMYFSRVNHESFNRLTYVLSGVAEPSELIKDKNISPFNIGEKIYLDDFSRAEFDEFLTKAGVEISGHVANRIFHWCSGNPRMTWDITAAVEDLYLSNDDVSVDDVDAAVAKIYFDRFDLAPVDHIRNLVESDQVIRSAVLKIVTGSEQSLDDRERSKLYLAGITRSGTEGEVKNRVLSTALSADWLRSISGSPASLTEAAKASYAIRDYDATIKLYDQYMIESPDETTLDGSQRLELGIARFHLGDFERAVDDLEMAVLSYQNEPLIAQSLVPYIGGALLRSGRTTDAISYLESSLKKYGSNTSLSVKVALASAYAGGGGSGARRIVELLADDLANAPATSPDDAAASTIVSAVYYLSKARHDLGDARQALTLLDNAIDAAQPRFLPALHLHRSSLSRSQVDKREATLGATRAILNHELRSAPGTVFGLEYHLRHLALTAAAALSLGLRADFDKLFQYAKTEPSMRSLSDTDVAVRLYDAADGTAASSELEPLLLWIRENLITEAGHNKYRFKILRGLASNTNKKLEKQRKNWFLEEFIRYADEPDFTDANLLTFLGVTADMVAERDFIGVIQRLEFLYKHVDYIERLRPVVHVVLLHQMLAAHSQLGQMDDAEDVARRLVKAVDAAANSDIEPELKSLISNQRTFAQNFLTKRTLEKRFENGRSPARDPLRDIGRNEVVTLRDPATQIVFKKKFKFVEADLRAGRLVLVTEDVPLGFH